LEHYTIGHDDVFVIFNVAMQEFNPHGPQVSLLFGEIGDVRLSTVLSWIYIIMKAREDPTQAVPLHFERYRHAPLAKNLIMMILFQDLSSSAVDGTTDQAIEATATMFHTYASPIMPQFAFSKLQETITTTASILKAGRQPLSWVYLLEMDFPLYIQALTVWQGEALAFISSSDVIPQIQR
jgi:hypothetical protein